MKIRTAGGPAERAIVRLLAGCAGMLLALAVFSAAQAHAALYIGTTGIARSNLDGSLLDHHFLAPPSLSVCAIAVDSSHIYWTDSYGDTISRARLDGTGAEGNFITLPAESIPCGLAVNSEFIYWANMGADTIGRARLDGSEVDESFISTGSHPCALAINQDGIYWASDAEGAIWRTDLAGLNGPELIIGEHADDPCGLALVGPQLFWVESIEGTIGRARLDGSEAQPEFVTGGHYPVSVVAQGEHLYWVNNGAGTVGRSDLSGADVNQALIAGLSHPYALAADSVHLVPPPPPAPPPPASALKLGKLRRQQDASVLFPVDLPGSGKLAAVVRGAKVKVQPGNLRTPAFLGAGRRWLKVTPPKKRGDGSPCVLRAIKRGDRVKMALSVNFSEPGKTLFTLRQPFVLFKPAAVRAAKAKKQKSRLVRCRR